MVRRHGLARQDDCRCSGATDAVTGARAGPHRPSPRLAEMHCRTPRRRAAPAAAYDDNARSRDKSAVTATMIFSNAPVARRLLPLPISFRHLCQPCLTPSNAAAMPSAVGTRKRRTAGARGDWMTEVDASVNAIRRLMLSALASVAISSRSQRACARFRASPPVDVPSVSARSPVAASAASVRRWPAPADRRGDVSALAIADAAPGPRQAGAEVARRRRESSVGLYLAGKSHETRRAPAPAPPRTLRDPAAEALSGSPCRMLASDEDEDDVRRPGMGPPAWAGRAAGSAGRLPGADVRVARGRAEAPTASTAGATARGRRCSPPPTAPRPG
jgi:hypothetical protein